MAVKLLPQGAGEGQHRQERHKRCQDGVGEQKRKIDRANPPLTGKVRCSRVKMINQIRDEKQHGDRKRSQHTGAMGLLMTLTDVVVPNEQEHRTGGI